MAGDIATAYIALAPSMRGFGSAIVQQAGPQIAAAGQRLGTQGGAALGSALGGSAAKASIPAINQVNAAIASASASSRGWLESTASMAFKNVALYGSMYIAINSVKDGVSAAFDAMVNFNAEIEQANIGFETLLGSSAAAEDQMAWIRDFAKETPFGYDNLVRYSQQLLALGFNAEQSRQVLQATGDAAAALGRGEESIARINLALGQMWTKGKVQSQEMLQLTESGIAAWQILADAYGVSIAEVQEAVTKGLVTAEQAVPALIEGMNARFAGLMERQSHTYAGIISNIQDTLQQQLAEAGEPLFEELSLQAQRFLDALDDPEIIAMMKDFGQAAADGARFIAQVAEAAWEARDAIVAIGVGVVAAKLLQRIPVGSIMHAPTVSAVAEAQRAYAAGLTRTSAALAGMSKFDLGRLAPIGQMVGLTAAADGLFRIADAGDDAGQSVLGFAETVGGATLAGAAFGSAFGPLGTAIGGVTGAVVGLTGSLWSMQAAMDAANGDTTLAQEALRNLGVEANLASVALQGITNEQLAAVGGFEAIADAMRAGNYAEFVTGIQDQIDALYAQRDALGESGDGINEMFTQMGDLEDQARILEGALAALGVNSEYLAQAQEQVVFQTYQAAFAADMQTGSLGAMTEAAWQAIIAEGGLGAEALQAAARMEGLAGVAGFATEMITGIPRNTPINFSTNANDILAQIINLRAAAEAGFSDLGMTADGYERRVQALQQQYRAAISSGSVSLSLPGGGGGGGSRGGGGSASRAVDAAKRAAEEAARKLQRDRDAQVRFGDAFGALMEAALEGNFEQFRDRLEEQITRLTRDGYKKAAETLKSLSSTLTQVALDYAALTNKLDVASDAYEDLTARMEDQRRASRDLILDLGAITDAQSFDQLAYLLGETTTRAQQYQDVLTQLKEQGLSEELWNQLAQAGPESIGLAQSILDQGAAGIEQLNSLSGGLVEAADSMGDLVADSMYQQGVDAMKAYIEGLKSQASALEAQLEQIANNVLDKTALAITPGNAGYSPISAAPQQVVNTFHLNVDAKDLDGLKSVQELIAWLEQQPTTQLVNQAGTVTS